MRKVFTLLLCCCSLVSMAITEKEGIAFVNNYYRLITQYATAESPSLATKIGSMHLGNGYVYPDVEINLGRISETKGVAIKSVYLASISSRQNILLKFVPKEVALEGYKDGIYTMMYKLYVYSGNEQVDRDVLKYTVPLKMEIQNNKIRSIYKGIRTIPQYTLSVTPTSLSFDATGGTRKITVNSNTTWNISVNTASWGHLTRSGNTLTLRVDANTSSSSRTDYFKIKAGDKEEKISITQDGKVITPTLSVSPTYLSFGSSGGSRTITVTSNTDWSISINPASWGHLTRSGNTLTLRVDANTGSSSRTDYFKIKAGDKEEKINITQDGKSKDATVYSTYITHNLTRYVWNGMMNVPVNYMRIHCHFEVSGCKGENIQVCAYFDYQNGTKAPAQNYTYRTSDGQATVQGKVKCPYDGTEWENYTLEIPYYALPMGNLKMVIQIKDSKGNLLAESSEVSFTRY